jgi:glyoxylate/hydroxypyruvate reductase A
MPGAVLIAVEGPTASDWLAQFRALATHRDIRQWPNVGERNDIAYACVWRPPRGTFANLPNLRAVFSLSAGVDRVLDDRELPNVPLARAVHGDLTMRMVEYVTLHVLMHHRSQRIYDAQQRERIWRGHHQPAAVEVSVGVMGLGKIGLACATSLTALGFQVASWSRTAKNVPGIASFHGNEGLAPFLARTEILVCILPQTPETEGLLNLELLRKLKRNGALGGAHLINAARGRLQVDADILTALDDGSLARATLDVFPIEPLPQSSPLWTHPRVTITPHNAGDLEPRVLTAAVLDQIERFERGAPLENLVDRQLGY